MFKKKGDVALAPSHLVSGADRKRLLRRVTEELHLGPEAAAELLPPKAQLGLARFSPPCRAALYTLDSEPWLLDERAGRRNDLIPTVLALWRAPGLLPAVPVRHAAVSHFLLNGADLMLPGVQPEALPRLPAGAVCSICVPGNPAPFAVGRMLMSSEQMAERAGGKGRCMELLHAFGDMLWALSPSRAVPNDGFSMDGVLPVEAGSSGAISDADTEAQRPTDGTAADVAGQVSRLRLGPDDPAAAPIAAEGESATTNGAADIGGDAAGAGSASGQAPDAQPSQATVSPAEMDALLQEALLQALHGIKDKQLPLAGGSLWAGHVVPGRRMGTHLDLKASSHKKLSKLLQAHGQGGSWLLTLREDKASGEVSLTGVDRSHSLYRQHTRWPADEAAGAVTAAEEAASNLAGLQITEMFRPHVNLARVFEAVGADPKALYTQQQASEVAIAYAQRAQLDRGASSPSHILLDATMCDALFKGVLKKGEPFPMELPKSQLRGAFMARMLPQLQLTRGSLTAVKKGAPPPVQVTTEKRSGNKKITRVVGVEAYLLDAVAVATDLQRRFAASATVAELPGDKSKGHHEIVLQGEVVNKLGAYLESAFGIPGKYILVKAPPKKGGRK